MEEFNLSHTWLYVRLSILKRDKYRCSICGMKKSRRELDVDHIIPVRCGIDPYERANLRALCKQCHRAKTKLDRISGL